MCLSPIGILRANHVIKPPPAVKIQRHFISNGPLRLPAGQAATPQSADPARILTIHLKLDAKPPLDGGYQFVEIGSRKDRTYNKLFGINNEGRVAGTFGSGDKGHPSRRYTISTPSVRAGRHTTRVQRKTNCRASTTTTPSSAPTSAVSAA
jgi:hypothetical protein